MRSSAASGRSRSAASSMPAARCTTSLAPNLTVLMIGWSFLEGLGAVLIMPAIVALVASNFGKPERPRAYGLVAAAGAIAAALGPVIGGAFTTYASWRWVFAGEVLIIVADPPVGAADERHPGRGGCSPRPRRNGAFGARPRLDRARASCESGTWGFVQPKPEAPTWLGLSPVIWMVLAGGVALALFLAWENRRIERGQGALIDPSMLRNLQLRNGVMSFLFMFLVQAGIFFTVPLFLSIALGLSAIETGVRLLPLSLSLLALRRRDPEAACPRPLRDGSSASDSWSCSPAWCSWSPLGRRGGSGDHHLAAAAGRRRPRGPGLTARERDRLVGSRRAKRRGRRASEHRHPARRLDRHRAGRRRADLRADRLVLHRHPGQPERSGDRRHSGADRARSRNPVRLRRRPARPRSPTRRARSRQRTRSWRRTLRAGSTGCGPRSRSWRSSLCSRWRSRGEYPMSSPAISRNRLRRPSAPDGPARSLLIAARAVNPSISAGAGTASSSDALCEGADAGARVA